MRAIYVQIFSVEVVTLAAVAEKLGRKWISCDLGRFAIHTTRKRLIGVQREQQKRQRFRAFEVLNLGKYERQFLWIDLTNGNGNRGRFICDSAGRRAARRRRASPPASRPGSPRLLEERIGGAVRGGKQRPGVRARRRGRRRRSVRS